MARSTLLAILCVAVGGCGGGCSGSVDEEPSSSASQRTEASGGEADEGATRADAPPVDPGPRPEVRVTAEVDPQSRQVTPRVENHGDTTQLASGVAVERQRGETWSPVESVGIELRFSCDEVAPECVTLAPGAVFIPPPWLGSIGDAQCICERCVDAEPGTYRFVVRSCGGGHDIAGEPFELRR